jgi:hypothetical protein
VVEAALERCVEADHVAALAKSNLCSVRWSMSTKDRLKVEDLQVFDVIRKLSFGKVYRVWVNEEELIASIPSNDPEKAKRTLASMKSRGILEEGPGIWRAIL